MARRQQARTRTRTRRSAGTARSRAGTARSRANGSSTKEQLYGVAKRLDVKGRSKMNKPELLRAINRASQRQSSRGRSR